MAFINYKECLFVVIDCFFFNTFLEGVGERVGERIKGLFFDAIVDTGVVDTSVVDSNILILLILILLMLVLLMRVLLILVLMILVLMILVLLMLVLLMEGFPTMFIPDYKWVEICGHKMKSGCVYRGQAVLGSRAHHSKQ